MDGNAKGFWCEGGDNVLRRGTCVEIDRGRGYGGYWCDWVGFRKTGMALSVKDGLCVFCKGFLQYQAGITNL